MTSKIPLLVASLKEEPKVLLLGDNIIFIRKTDRVKSMQIGIDTDMRLKHILRKILEKHKKASSFSLFLVSSVASIDKSYY